MVKSVFLVFKQLPLLDNGSFEILQQRLDGLKASMERRHRELSGIHQLIDAQEKNMTERFNTSVKNIEAKFTEHIGGRVNVCRQKIHDLIMREIADWDEA